jgi:hypothetical protein
MLAAVLRRFLFASCLLAVAEAAAAGQLRCNPCAGFEVDDPSAAALALSRGLELDSDSTLFVKWRSGPEAVGAEPARAIAKTGATPWLTVALDTPSPLLDNLEELEAELEGLAALAREIGGSAHFELLWSGSSNVEEYAFLIKRVSVAVAGAQPDARIFTAPLDSDADYLRRLFAEEVAAYLDGVTFAAAPPEELRQMSAVLIELDPGAIVAVDSLPAPEEPLEVLAEAARYAEAGAEVALFDLGSASAETVRPFKLLARDFSGDLSLDPYSRPGGVEEAWSFVRGKDLQLRVIAKVLPGLDSVTLEFPDPQLRSPSFVDMESGERIPLWGFSRTRERFDVEIADPTPVVLLELERMTAAELEGILGVEERVTVADTRQMPVEEILRRLQAFEDAQARRIRNYSATNTTHLRFQFGTSAETLETTFRGPFFYRQDGSFDWAWREFLINGVKWRGKSIPEIPLIQPEKAAALPVEITFTREYRYSLRGTATLEGRDCWVVDFEPAVAVAPERTLYQGTVWVDRELYARVRTRAVQLGLEGDVISNEETVTFSPVDAEGRPAAWLPGSYFLPLTVEGQQLWSILSATPVVERQILLSDIEINPENFEERLGEILASDDTMVRDTEQGLRYLVMNEETGEREVQEELDLSRRFVVGGIFADEGLDFPIPLAGFNWLWFDWRGTGTQANIFFAGALLNVAVTNPSLFGSKFDAGFDLFALAVQGTDTLFRDGVEMTGEEVEVSNPNLDLKLGRSLGNFAKLDLQYQLGYRNFSRGDDTAEEFVLPVDHLNHTVSLTGRYNRKGYRFRLGGNYHVRDKWEPWGIPGNDDFDPDHETYTTWDVSLAKTWHFPRFLKFGVEFEYVDGSDLDRFSKYDFSFFSDTRVRGYQSGKVRAEEALAAHLAYGFDVGQLFRIDLLGDAAWATDQVAGLDRELLAGLGVAGTFVGPWRTVINLDVGVAVAGPDDGVTAFLAVLKLFQPSAGGKKK